MNHENNQLIKTLVKINKSGESGGQYENSEIISKLLFELDDFQKNRHIKLHNKPETNQYIQATKREQTIFNELSQKIEISTNENNLAELASGYLENYRKFHAILKAFIKKQLFLKANLDKLDSLESELNEITSRYQEDVLSHIQNIRSQLNSDVKKDSYLILAIVIISISFVAVTIWLITNRGIVSRLNAMANRILSERSEASTIDTTNHDEIDQLSAALETLIDDQRHLKFSNDILKDVAKADEYDSILRKIVLWYESAHKNSICTIVLIDKDKHIAKTIAPSLPTSFGKTIERMDGKCEAFNSSPQNKTAIIEDIAESPNWRALKGIVNLLDLKTCWSRPIQNSKSEITGYFSVYNKTHKKASAEKLFLIRTLADKIGFTIESIRQKQALKESEERFRTFLFHSPDAIFVHNINGKFLIVNQKACDNLGYSRDELLNLGVTDIEKKYQTGRIADLMVLNFK